MLMDVFPRTFESSLARCGQSLTLSHDDVEETLESLQQLREAGALDARCCLAECSRL